MSAMITTPLLNGLTSTAQELSHELHEFEKILRIRDEVFAGTHPRLTVPAHAIRKVSPLPAPSTVLPPSSSSKAHHTNLPGLTMSVGEEKELHGEQGVNNSTSLKSNIVSDIDPVFLMKSDELVKAETQLHRQRLEKALRDQFEQKRLDARKKPAPGEAKPDFDVAAVYNKVLETAKQDGTATPKEDVSNEESYDENSLYSSRAPDSTPEVGELEDSASSQNQNLVGASFGANGPAETQVHSAASFVAAEPARHVKSPAHKPRKPSGVVEFPTIDKDDEEEEGEYSPPEAVEQFVNAGEASLQTMVDPRMRPLRRYSELDDGGKGPGSPGDHMRINSRMRNGRQNHRGRPDSPRQSPDPSGQGGHPRKKRKIDKKGERRKRNGAASPDVKDEPVSPPPFHDVQPLGSGRPKPTANDRPIIIDDGPVREVRYMPAPDPYLSSPMRPASRQAEPLMPLSEPRVVSRGALRPARDDTDLRRVASMHNMRVEQPREYVDTIYDSPSRGRAASYLRVESPMRMEPPRMAEQAPSQQIYERDANQGVRVMHSPGPVYREVYQGGEPEVRYVPEPMPPPPIERIVVDQYGRRFREIIQERASVAPRSYSTYPDRGQPTYYDTYDRSRDGTGMMEARQESRVVEEMPRQQIVRQVGESGPSYREVYDAPPSRSGSVRPIDQPPRQPVYVDERPEYRAPVRIGSVRPMGARYDEMLPPPMTARAGSVRPAAREGSVFIDDRSQPRREYLPVEAPRYRVVEPETRYIDAQGREISYVDGGQDTSPRYVQRY